MLDTVCPECKARFQAKSKSHRFCSAGCRVGFYSHGKKYIKGFGKAKCGACNQLFSKNSVNQIYCCSDCRVAKIGYVKAELGNGVCLWCDLSFPKAQHNQVYCSKGCGDAFRNSGDPEPIAVRFCPHCETQFDPAFAHQVYCGGKCKRRSRQTISYFTIFSRDKFTCGYCGSSPLKSADTKLGLTNVCPGPSKNDVASNVITSCINCQVAMKTQPPNNQSEVEAVIAQRNAQHSISPTARVNMARKHSSDRF